VNHDSDLIAAFAVLFLALMIWAWGMEHLMDFTALGTMQSGIVETGD
jgi:hypothetical protein